MATPHDDEPLPRGPTDAVDRGLDEWKATEAAYPVLTIELLARLGRVRTHIERTLAPIYESHGLAAAEFYVLASLVRQPEQRLSQADLARAMNLTPGTVSVRVSGMVDRGLVTATTPPDGRGRIVAATQDGAARFDACQAELRFHQDRLFSALDDARRADLAALLRRLGLDYEAEDEGGSRRFDLLGVELAPAHLARLRRAEVGLPDRTGLLVTNADDDSALRVGDLVIAADGRPVTSILDLVEAAPIDRLTVLRNGTDETTIEVQR